MLITIDEKTHTQVEIGDKEPTPELIRELRIKYRIGVFDCTNHPFINKRKKEEEED